jgi:hypothetical protein
MSSKSKDCSVVGSWRRDASIYENVRLGSRKQKYLSIESKSRPLAQILCPQISEELSGCYSETEATHRRLLSRSHSIHQPYIPYNSSLSTRVLSSQTHFLQDCATTTRPACSYMTHGLTGHIVVTKGDVTSYRHI